MEVDSLENFIMDLIQDEIEMQNKGKEMKDNFKLCAHKPVAMFTKWKRNLLTEDDKCGYFKNFTRNKRRKRYLRRQMRNFISKLEIPLYFNLRQVQFHDTLNGIIRSTFYLTH